MKFPSSGECVSSSPFENTQLVLIFIDKHTEIPLKRPKGIDVFLKAKDNKDDKFRLIRQSLLPSNRKVATWKRGKINRKACKKSSSAYEDLRAFTSASSCPKYDEEKKMSVKQTNKPKHPINRKFDKLFLSIIGPER